MIGTQGENCQMSPDFYDDYLQHELTRAEAKKVFDDWICGCGEQPDIRGMVNQFEKKVFSTFMLLQQKAAAKEIENNSDGPWRASVQAAAAEVEASRAAPDDKPKIRLSDIRDFANG